MTPLEQAEAEQASPDYLDDRDAVLKRLRRVEGQIRGLQRMVQEDQYCIDVLTQVAATTKALRAVAMHLLQEHLDHCVREAMVGGGQVAQDKITEASRAIERLLRT